MKLIIILSSLLLVSCGSSKINLSQSKVGDTFQDESFMRYGHARLSGIETKDELKKSLIHCYKGNFKKGMSTLKLKLNDNRKNHKYWLYIGNCYELYGNTAKSNYYYDFAMAGNNTIKAAVLNNRALIAMKAYNYNEASSLLTKAIELAPNVKVTKYNLAQLYIKFNHTQKAKSLLAPYSRSSNDIDLIFSMMSIELMEGNLKAAQSWESKLSDKDMRREDISLYRSLLYFELKDYKKAKMALGMQRPTIIKEIQRASRELNSRIDIELKRIQDELDSKDAKVKKGVNRVAIKN